MSRLFSSNRCFRFLISQAFNLFDLIELAYNLRFSYNISVYSLQHLVEEEACYTLDSVFSISVTAHPTVQHHMLSKSCKKMCINHYPVKTIKVIPRNPIQVNTLWQYKMCRVNLSPQSCCIMQSNLLVRELHLQLS